MSNESNVLTVHAGNVAAILTQRFAQASPGSGLTLTCHEAHMLIAALNKPASAVALRPALGPQDEEQDAILGLHRCKVCGTRWLLWPDVVHGGGWNLLDGQQRPGACCDNAAMGDQIEHLRDIPLTVSVSALRGAAPDS